MDATENDVPSHYDVQGFPTIYFAPKNDKQNPRRYDVRAHLFPAVRLLLIDLFSFVQGGREVDDFIKYLAREATEPLVGYERNGSKKKGGKAAKDDEL